MAALGWWRALAGVAFLGTAHAITDDCWETSPPCDPRPYCDLGWAATNLDYASETWIARSNFISFAVNEDGVERNLLRIEDLDGNLLAWFTLFGDSEVQASHFCVNSVVGTSMSAGLCKAWTTDHTRYLTASDTIVIFFGSGGDDPMYVVYADGVALESPFTVDEYQNDYGWSFGYADVFRIDVNEAALDFITFGPLTTTASAATSACYAHLDGLYKAGQPLYLDSCADSVYLDGAVIRMALVESYWEDDFRIFDDEGNIVA